MAPQTAKSLMKEFRASFRRKKEPKIDKAKEIEEEERKKLAELKESLGPNLQSAYTDAHILSFLRARLLNVKDAEKLLKTDYNMKKFLNIQELVNDYDVTSISKDYSCSSVIGCDKEGSLVRVMNMGLCDVKGYVHCISTVEHLKVFLWFLENDLKLCEKRESQIQMVYILDLAHINLSVFLHKPALDTGLVALNLLQDHFHDLIKVVYVVNAPPLFHSSLKVIKPVIQDSLYRKIKIYNSDGFQEELLKHIDADILPVYLGGRKKGDDPLGKQLVGLGGEIPQSYYPDNLLDPTEDGVIHCTVAAGSSVSFRFPMVQERTLITYQFQAKENDIGVCLFVDDDVVIEKQKRKGEDVSKLMQLVPIIRSQCHLCPESGGFVTWFTGTLVVYFDNTYSWMSSKEVTFKVNLEPLTDSNNYMTKCIRKEVMQKI
ncbi:retinal-binding protein [Parasteatoda tepidariorum]|uniref:retinal-binding protein n=1 Tax=Parasteatoda tepidariorum TaxID=114398 RepID=UPI001C71F5C1|nr:retinal-binding protein [Parasteatoda tepidariorum]